MLGNLPSRKRFRRRTRLEQAAAQIERSNVFMERAMTSLGYYSDPKNWKPTDETKDVMENSIVTGVERIFSWVGPLEGPQLAQRTIAMLVTQKPQKQEEANEK